ncbi:hypothetical protein [Chryseobacterium sp.]|uniref:hypothetical protein n=1 Tax=Chryseobacterium sp. TaxID=1871047 RepID=UPI0011CCAE29|nr:hypothetical protein [Chryseobacterium sp.]TXF76049.1 hypothetical protein FUA25_09130 [Chryseobacterium sp.]
MENDEKQTAFEKTTETIGWLRIFLSPFLIGLIISAVIYFSYPNIWTMIASCAVLALSVVLGAKMASNAAKEHGTMNYISRTAATPELDENLKKDQNDTR